MTDQQKDRPAPPPHPKRPPPLEPDQTELTEEQKDYLRGRLKTLATLQRLTKKFKPGQNPDQ